MASAPRTPRRPAACSASRPTRTAFALRRHPARRLRHCAHRSAEARSRLEDRGGRRLRSTRRSGIQRRARPGRGPRRLDLRRRNPHQTGRQASSALAVYWPRSMALASRLARAALFVLAVSGYVAATAAPIDSHASGLGGPTLAQGRRAATPDTQSLRTTLDTYCVTCHNQRLKTAGLALDTVDAASPHTNPEVWEKVIARLRAGSMPPAGRPRPDGRDLRSIAAWLEADIDRAWAAAPNPGRINAVHRLNRTRVQQRHPRSVRARPRREVAAARRRDGRRQLRQLRRRPHDLDRAPRALPVGRRARSRGWRPGLPPAAPGARRPSRFRCTSCRTIGRAKTCRSDRAAASRFATTSRSTASTSIKVRLRRQYQDYLMGMGWPQQLDVRLDGKLLKRFTVGGGAPGRPAAASYAGDGEPGFAGDPEWEKYMQVDGDAGPRGPRAGRRRDRASSACRSSGSCGSRKACRSRCSAAGCSRTTSSTWTTRASARSRSAARTRSAGAGARTRRAAARSSSASRRRDAEERGLRHEDPVAHRPARLSPAGHRTPTSQTLLDVLRRAAGATAAASTPASSSRSSGCWSIRTSCCASIAIRGTAAAPADGYRLSDLELASRLSFFLWSSIPDERLLDLAERGELTRPADARAAGAADAGRSARAADALVDDFAAQWLNLRRVDEVVVHPDRLSRLRRQPARGVQAGNRAVRRAARCARIAACSICCAPTTRSSTSGWRGTTAFPGIYGSRFRRVTLPESRSARRAARARRAAGDDLVSRPHLAGAARQVAARQHLRRAGAAAAARRRHHAAGDQARRRAADHPRAAGAASAESGVQQLPRGDRSARLRARELRRDRRLADRRRIGQAGRRHRHHGERRDDRRARGPAGAAARRSPISFRAR